MERQGKFQNFQCPGCQQEIVIWDAHFSKQVVGVIQEQINDLLADILVTFENVDAKISLKEEGDEQQ